MSENPVDDGGLAPKPALLPAYEEIFTRNIGFVDENEQGLLRRARIAGPLSPTAERFSPTICRCVAGRESAWGEGAWARERVIAGVSVARPLCWSCCGVPGDLLCGPAAPKAPRRIKMAAPKTTRPAASTKKGTKPGPSPFDVTFAAVNAALDLDKHAEAIELLTRALEAEPTNAALLQSRGAVYVMLGTVWSSNPGEAEARALQDGVQDLTAAIALHPTYADAYLNRGLARRALLDRAGAYADMTHALELGLEPPLQIQAYSYRSTNTTGDQVADVAVVNTMRRDWRRVGKTWDKNFPQRICLRASVPAAPSAP
jgi:hypothetical protein